PASWSGGRCLEQALALVRILVGAAVCVQFGEQHRRVLPGGRRVQGGEQFRALHLYQPERFRTDHERCLTLDRRGDDREQSDTEQDELRNHAATSVSNSPPLRFASSALYLSTIICAYSGSRSTA